MLVFPARDLCLPPVRHDPERLFVKDGFKHYRRTYSLTEVRWGFAVLTILVAVASYIWWRGQNPDPELLGGGSLTGSGDLPGAAATRGPVPDGLAAEGWSEGGISQFTAENLYVKINGRADYFLSFGFERLHFVPLRAGSDDEAPTVDIEMYDLATPANALGAFSGEAKEGEPESTAAGMKVYSRNALFLTHGPYYVRAIGSEESAAVTAQLTRIDEAFAASAGDVATEKPWANELFEGQLGIPPGAVSYARENAFSLEFARDVYSARLDDDTELFVTAAGSADAATALTAKFIEGFASYGEELDGGWVEDKYIQTVATAVAVDKWVLGIRSAPNVERGTELLTSLRAGFDKLPDDVKARAVPAAAPDTERENEPEPENETDVGEEY